MGKMNQCTQGPWMTTHHGEWIVGRDSVAGEVVIAKAGFNWESNARLIAACPDLLEALVEMVEIAEAQGHLVPRARAAIAKATGEKA